MPMPIMMMMMMVMSIQNILHRSKFFSVAPPLMYVEMTRVEKGTP